MFDIWFGLIRFVFPEVDERICRAARYEIRFDYDDNIIITSVRRAVKLNELHIIRERKHITRNRISVSINYDVLMLMYII